MPSEPRGTMPEIQVTAGRLDQDRAAILPDIGATRYSFTRQNIENIPQGENAPLGQVLLRAPGVVQDGFGRIHVRGDHGNLQYRFDGVQLPEGLSAFTQVFSSHFTDTLSLLTGALPAQYGLTTAGVVDISVRSGTTDPGAEAAVMTGSYNWMQPVLQYGGRSGPVDYFAVGQFTSNSIGMENPSDSYQPLHDETRQWYALAKVTGIVDEQTRLSLIGGGAAAGFQIPNLPFQAPVFTVRGTSSWDSTLLDQRQWESTYFAIGSLQKSYRDLNFQVSAFARYTSLAYQPDPMGDLLYNGFAPWAVRQGVGAGLQGDASWKLSEAHTLRGGYLVQREQVGSTTWANALPLVAGGTVPGGKPVGIFDQSDLTAWTYSVYLQDEWRVLPSLTVNLGLRFDAVSGATSENQLSPRFNVVWEPVPSIVVRAGYARYFVPPPLGFVTAGSLASRAGTTEEPSVMLNDPVRAERSDYIDFGLTVKPLPHLELGFSGYYKFAENYVDEGQFGAPVLLSAFNYAYAQVKGFEVFASYDDGPWSIYANLAWSRVSVIGFTSAQFNASQAELDYIAVNWIPADHDQGVSGSAGISYAFGFKTDHATRLSADLIYGSGLRTTVTTPNDTSLPRYVTLNLSITQSIPILEKRSTRLRFDLLNVTDSQYQLRTGEGVGVGAPQYGMRRAFFLTLSQKF
jgi:outer membrane receptor protein involved in Fe transport